MALTPKITHILFTSLFLFLAPLQILLASTISDLSPVAHWTCDETSGIRYDSTANALDLTDNNTVSYATGLLNNACDFEQSNSEYLSITDANQAGLLETNSYTISMWLYREADSVQGLVSRGTLSNRNFQFQLSNASEWGQPYVIYHSQSPNDGGTDSGQIGKYNASGIAENNWFHIVLVRDNATSSSFYIDGTRISSLDIKTANSAVTNTTQTFNFGLNSYGSNYYDGLMDEITWFDYALSPTEITTLYNSGTPLQYTSATPTPTSTPSTTSSTNNGDLVFLLSIIIFFLATIWIGMLVSTFRNRK